MGCVPCPAAPTPSQISPTLSAQAWPQQLFIDSTEGAAPASPLLPQLLDGHVLLTILLHHLREGDRRGPNIQCPNRALITPKPTPRPSFSLAQGGLSSLTRVTHVVTSPCLYPPPPAAPSKHHPGLFVPPRPQCHLSSGTHLGHGHLKVLLCDVHPPLPQRVHPGLCAHALRGQHRDISQCPRASPAVPRAPSSPSPQPPRPPASAPRFSAG